MSKKIIILPCSGIGKAFGTITRETVFKVTGELRPNDSEKMCLSLLVKEDEEALSKIKGQKVITIDGCAKLCSQKSVEYHSGNIVESIKVMDIIRENKGLKPGTVTNIGEDGWRLVEIISEKVCNIIDTENGRIK